MSGSGRGTQRFESLKNFFSARDGSFSYHFAESREQAIDATRKVLREGVEQIVAVGGDGTLNAVANGFFESGKLISPMAHLAFGPEGTGCDYYRSVRGQGPWEEEVLRGIVECVDLGELAQEGPSPFYFLNMASAGLSAEVVRRRAERRSRYPSALSYCLPVIQGIFTYKPTRAEIMIDDQKVDLDVIAVLVAKGKCAGRGMRVAETVTLTDGRFEVTTVAPLGFGDLRRLVPLYRGGLEDGIKIRKFFGKTIRVHADKKMPVEVDGDLAGTTDMTLTLRPKALPFCLGGSVDTAIS
jgi:diacylglycerol kinase (ATP)